MEVVMSPPVLQDTKKVQKEVVAPKVALPDSDQEDRGEDTVVGVPEPQQLRLGEGKRSPVLQPGGHQDQRPAESPSSPWSAEEEHQDPSTEDPRPGLSPMNQAAFSAP